MSEVLLATSRTIWAPMFSNLSSSSISLATVTPSLVIRGAPKDFSSTTLRPLGPSVTRTALARMSTPRSILSRASTENFTSLAAIALLLPEFVACSVPWPDGDDLALLRLLFGGVGNDDPSRGFFLGVNALDNNTVVKRTKLHRHPPKFLIKLLFWRRADGRKVFPDAVRRRHRRREYGLQGAVMKNISTRIRGVPEIFWAH